MAGPWPKSQVDAERKRLGAALVNGGSVTISNAEGAIVREALKLAIEHTSETMQAAERSGRDAIVRALAVYRADMVEVLARISRQLKA